MLKSLKRHVPFNPPKKTYLLYPPRQRTGQGRPTDRTAKAFDTLTGSGRQGYNAGTASAASVVRWLNGGGLVGRVLAPFNEIGRGE